MPEEAYAYEAERHGACVNWPSIHLDHDQSAGAKCQEHDLFACTQAHTQAQTQEHDLFACMLLNFSLSFNFSLA